MSTHQVPVTNPTHVSEHTSSRNGKKPTMIVLHHSAGTNSLQYLTKNRYQVSTHLLIAKDGTIYRMVPDELAANTVGYSAIGVYNNVDSLKGSCNQISLNIEIENKGDGIDPYTNEQLYSVAYSIVKWRKRYGYLFVISHELIDTRGKNDPYHFPWAQLESLYSEVIV